MSSIRRIFVGALYLSFPVWALLLLLALLSVLPGGAQTPGELTIFLGALAPFVGAIPVFRANEGPGVKALLFAAYYGACAVAMFVVGWAALGVLGLAR